LLNASAAGYDVIIKLTEVVPSSIGFLKFSKVSAVLVQKLGTSATKGIGPRETTDWVAHAFWTEMIRFQSKGGHITPELSFATH
jgi:hypothetical protein